MEAIGIKERERGVGEGGEGFFFFTPYNDTIKKRMGIASALKVTCPR